MPKLRSSLAGFFLTVLFVGLLALLGPEEESLGANVRVVYLHGAWVLTAEIALLGAALSGVAGLITRNERFHDWSAALGRTGLVFWLTYLPLSLWAMQSNWNGLFLAEPRFRLALSFTVAGLLLQAGLWVFNTGWLTSSANILFFIVLKIVFSTAANVMHPPPSPIFNSGNYAIIGFFLLLNVSAWVAALFLTRLLMGIQQRTRPGRDRAAES